MKVEPLDPAALAPRLKPITRAYLAGDPKLRSAFDVDWKNLSAIVARAKQRKPIEAPVADAVEAYLKRLGAPAAAMASMKKLRDGAVCVVAGQQPGLMGGPLYNAAKALTAIRLARTLEEKGLPCVPLFWIHSDDHDPDRLGQLGLPGATVSIPLPDDGRTLSARPAEPARVAAEIEAKLPETPHRAAVAARLRSSARETLAEGFAASLLDWFGGLGLVVLEPSHLDGPRAKAVFDRVIREPGLVDAAVGRQTGRLKQAGFDGALLGSLGTNVFEIRDGKRTKVDGKPGGGRLSAGVALRPVLQDSVLPVAAYVAGPNEIAYLAQLPELYRSFGVVMSTPVPRGGLTVIEPKIARFLEKLSLGTAEWLVGREKMLDRAAAKRHGALLNDVAKLEGELHMKLANLGESLGRIDASLVDLAKKTSGKAGQVLSAFRDRVVESLRRADETDARQITTVAEHLVPGGNLQERELSPWYFLAAAGPELFGEILAQVDPLSGSHLLVRL